jgi:hypothetical protein
VSFAAITLCVASLRVFIAVVYFVIDSVRKLLDIPLYEESSRWHKIGIVIIGFIFLKSFGFYAHTAYHK